MIMAGALKLDLKRIEVSRDKVDGDKLSSDPVNGDQKSSRYPSVWCRIMYDNFKVLTSNQPLIYNSTKE